MNDVNLTKKFLGSALFFLLLTAPALVCAQYRGSPVKKNNLIQALRSRQFQTRDIVQIINESGVDFKLTPLLQNELVGAGARPEVIEAVRSNYRTVKPAYTESVSTKNKSSFKGTALSKEMIIKLLNNDTSDSIIKKQVKQNGVNFQVNERIAAEIKTAGGKKDLIKLISDKYNPNESEINYGNVSAGNKPSANSYDDLIQQAIYSFDTQKDFPGTLDALQQAVKISPNNPRAYQLLGYLNLYGFKNFAEAEKNWKLAIARGGSAVLRVIHDHNGVFLTTCQGSLYIARDAVRFESDNNNHTFETSDRNIKKVEVNNKFKRLIQLKSGSFKIVLKDKDDSTTFSFSPLSGRTDESKMIIRLIGKN